jgi:hypothetical protein
MGFDLWRRGWDIPRGKITKEEYADLQKEFYSESELKEIEEFKKRQQG